MEDQKMLFTDKLLDLRKINSEEVLVLTLSSKVTSEEWSKSAKDTDKAADDVNQQNRELFYILKCFIKLMFLGLYRSVF